ncbi:alpha/beta fold hydrolase [Roseobacteraceae bacterium NS-SX3]
MADFLLIHGSCHGAWCWRDLIPALEARGHAARAIDLPGHAHGRDPATVTLEETAEAVLAAATPESIVLGHSWAGFPITLAADRAPGAMRGLIYLCAYVPVPGLSLVDMRRRGPRQTIGAAAVKNAAGTSYTIDPDAAPELLYHDCAAETVAYALPRLCPQPIPPQDTPIELRGRWRSVPRAYIRCADDRTIPPEYQAQMAGDFPPHLVHGMDTSHSPFFAAPGALADLMGRIAKDF